MTDSWIAHEKMVKAALVVLDHAIHEAQNAPIKYPSPGVRFALSWLFAHSKGERGHFSQFLLALADGRRMISLEREREYVRHTHMDTCFKGIIRVVGYPETPQAKLELTATWQKP